jgi:hypothetical protein
VAKGLEIFELWATFSGERMIASGDLSFKKKRSVRMDMCRTNSDVWEPFGCSLCDLEENYFV